MLFEKKDRQFYKKRKSIQVDGQIVSLEKPIVMGILNCTPDSFFDGGKYQAKEDIKNRAEQIIQEGATIIDIGAYSSRPGADHISAREEIDRLKNALEIVKEIYPNVPISIDTFRSEVVEYLYNRFGAFIVNDISGGSLDERMFETVAKLHLPYMMMHMRGTPQTMQNLCEYNDVTQDVLVELAKKVERLRQLGVCDLVIDPGFGFSKTLDQNYELLNQLDAFKLFELPILVGISRKSMIWKLLNITPQDSLNGTTVLNTLALQQGASILRVHDVKESVETIQLVEKVKQG